MQIKVIGMPWYRPETFDRLRSLFEDGHKLHGTYDEWWFAAAERGRQFHEGIGVRVVRVDTIPDQLTIWCRTNGKKIDARARTRFASEMAHKTVFGG